MACSTAWRLMRKRTPSICV